MILTVILLLVAVALFVLGGILFGHEGKNFAMGKNLAKTAIMLVGAVALIWGVNRTGLGTTYYLTQANPGILQEMATAMQAQRTQGTSAEIKKYMKGHLDEMTRNAPIMGDPSAKNTIFVFSDYSCPYCRRVHADLKRVVADHPEVRVVMKNFSIHGVLSDFPAKAVIAAKMQGNDKAAALDAALMDKEYYPADLQGKSQDDLEKAIKKNVLAMADKVGIDTARLEKDVNSSTVSEELGQVRDLASRFQIGGTPFLIIGDQAFPGAIPYDQIVSALR
ncbi:MAG: DsbA family protein [Proteobacteria bacterium]|nr:DsbA family protein [Pseudomonadota bacterium]